jgi:isoleucyl-tRNA synthetase
MHKFKSERSRSFMKKILKMDNELLEKLRSSHREPEEVYKKLKERPDVYTEADKYPLSDMYRLYVRNIRNDILIEATIAAAKDDFAKQIGQIISRLDVIKNEVKNIKDKLSIT